MQTVTLYPHMLHGCDYNPEQWFDRPEILSQDILQMQQANINCVSLGIFAWSVLEPAEGEYCFDRLAEIISTLYANGIRTVLATPSAARPMWMDMKYPEVRRVTADRIRVPLGGRHNHCYTSPVLREKVRAINTLLAKRFAHDPGVILWHVGNEIQGECHCGLCQAAFREWLKARYGTLDALNAAWWTSFWSNTYTDWAQIESPDPAGDTGIQGLALDWKRFCTAQTRSFLENETAPLRAENPLIPVTTNFMQFYDGVNYRALAKSLDVTSWDCYPTWHCTPDGDESGQACLADAFSDICRSMLKKPFLLMENTPSHTNWHAVCRPKTWGFHRLTAISAIAHGADSIQYFQWRQSRGGNEKLHGAVMTHANRTDTRVFQEVSDLGRTLQRLDAVCGARTNARIAILYDPESHWAVNAAKGPRNGDIGDTDLMMRFYLPFWKSGYAVDFVDAETDFSGYHLLCVPMLYMLRNDVAKRICDFVLLGGTAVLTLHSGIADEHDLCFMSDTPAQGLAELAGIRYLESDPLYDGQHETMHIVKAPFPLAESYRLEKLCERVAPAGAEVLGVYGTGNPCMPDDLPCLTRHAFGRGTAYYVGAFAEDRFFADFLPELAERLGVRPVLDTTFPHGVAAAARQGLDGTEYLFIMNWTREQKSVNLPYALKDFESGKIYQSKLPLSPYGAKILVKA